jgi:hypothetical protein
MHDWLPDMTAAKTWHALEYSLHHRALEDRESDYSAAISHLIQCEVSSSAKDDTYSHLQFVLEVNKGSRNLLSCCTDFQRYRSFTERLVA